MLTLAVHSEKLWSSLPLVNHSVSILLPMGFDYFHFFLLQNNSSVVNILEHECLELFSSCKHVTLCLCAVLEHFLVGRNLLSHQQLLLLREHQSDAESAPEDLVPKMLFGSIHSQGLCGSQCLPALHFLVCL